MVKVNNPFADLEDTDENGNFVWDDGEAPAQQPERVAKPLTGNTLEDARDSENKSARFEEKCDKCRGTGKFVSYTGRVVGECFTCKGKGVRYFKRPRAEREKARQQAADRRERKAVENFDSFAERYPEVAEWLNTNTTFEFAVSLKESVMKYGDLTDKQLAAAQKCAGKSKNGLDAYRDEYPAVVKWLETNAADNSFASDLLSALKRFGKLTPNQLAAVERNVKRDAARDDAPESNLDVSVLKGLYAVPDGDTRLKLRVRTATQGRWKGYTFVDDGAVYGQRTNYGMQAPDGTYKGKCVEQLKAILADPIEAQAAYGKLTGTCGRCSRPLEDETSVAMGIGPVCREKLGM